MQISGYSWAGVRTHDFEETISFFTEVLELPLARTDDDTAVFRMASGQVFEVFGPNSRWYEFHACPVMEFQVEDVRAARKELETAGVEFVDEVTEQENGAQWTCFRGPDGYLYELQRPRVQ